MPAIKPIKQKELKKAEISKETWEKL